MKIQIGMKFRIYPNQTEKARLAIQFGHARFVYNHTLAARKEHFKLTGKGLSQFDCNKRITILKQDENFSWLKDADSQYPSFKSKLDDQKIRYPQRVKFIDNTTYLPKVGYIRTKFHRPLVGSQKSVTVSKTKTEKYFISVLCEYETETPVHNGPKVGIDLGLKDFLVTSDGAKTKHPKLLKKKEAKIKKAQKSLSRKRKGSKNRSKARLKLAIQHEKLTNARKDFHHKESARLTSAYSFIGTESLKVSNMMKNHCLAKAIADSGWSEFVRQLEYKSNWKGGSVFKIGTFFPSSKTCYKCKHINHDLKLSDRTWTCPGCGSVLDRDINAALNILEESTAGAAEI
jgi:putative transposase